MRLELGDEPLRFEFKLNLSTSSCDEAGEVRAGDKEEADSCEIVMSVIAFA